MTQPGWNEAWSQRWHIPDTANSMVTNIILIQKIFLANQELQLLIYINWLLMPYWKTMILSNERETDFLMTRAAFEKKSHCKQIVIWSSHMTINSFFVIMYYSLWHSDTIIYCDIVKDSAFVDTHIAFIIAFIISHREENIL